MSEILLGRLERLIAHHEEWGPKDFAYTQIILWVSILSSFTATILAATEAPSVLVAVIAGLPALTITIDKVFRYRERAIWHDRYAIELNNLRDELQISGMSADDIVKRLAALRKSMDEQWPGENMGGMPKSEEPKQGGDSEKAQEPPKE